jgi:hypothetical protein
VEDQAVSTSQYTLTEEGGRFVVRRPNGVVVFRVQNKYPRDAQELLDNLNRMLPKPTPSVGDDY